MKRCEWAAGSTNMQAYHDNEWGVPVHDDRKLFEFLILEGAQAGLSWSTILNKREGYRKAFDNFDASKIALYNEKFDFAEIIPISAMTLDNIDHLIDVIKENIDKSKIVLADNIISNIYPLFDDMYGEYLSSTSNLKNDYKKKKSELKKNKIPNPNKNVNRRSLTIFDDFKSCLFIPVQICRQVTFIVGMHRSGTSLLGRLLNKTGIDYGYDKAVVKNTYNENGYFENMTILRFNEKVLTKMNWKWCDSYKLTNELKEIMFKYVDELKEIIVNQFDKSTNHFFIKDPRIVLLYPLYIEAFTSLGIFRYNQIFPTRNKKSVVSSLISVQKIQKNTAEKLYDHHYNLINDYEKIIPTHKYDYDDLIKYPKKTIYNILKFLHKDCNIANNLIDIVDIKYKHF